ncbi:sugar phosphate isomerase/epimerase family protein [Rhodothermus bifroesti]|jgi:sugar phosphate isomerase/epimerase|uniref:Sugar phosphate isomerase/epimerase n=1 Tax=Rhodothermus marinus TaxID=29549 RepID=A0A7V2AZ82_RHOMR|nr:sugar phosphate isomerase/epimerase [Rhodothermus bifroesti]GBD01831.1 Inosose dehydratase [bacterium HR18]
MDRRNFLRTAGGLALGSLAWASLGCDRPEASSTAGGSRRLERIGLQLYTVRTLMEQDVPRTLEQVAQLGYREVEFAGYYNYTPQELRQMLDQLELSAPATHVPFQMLEENLSALLEAAHTLGHRYVIVPWLPPEQRQTIDDYRRWAERFNRWGEACKAANVQFAYHNHDFEFARIGDQVPYDVLLAETDPELVKMELDLYWITYAGFDPLVYFQQHPGRFPLCHVKDMTADRQMVDVGQGTIDFVKIFAQAAGVQLQHYFVEHDQPADPLASIRRSYEYLSQLTF